MKPKLTALGLLICFLVMLARPQEVFDGAKSGLLLWFQIVLPTLLPFLIVSRLLIQSGAVFYVERVLSPVLSRLFHISSHAAFAVVTGFLCGCPMGAKVTADLVQSGRITRTEGQYLLSFCNNTSPMFLSGFVLLQTLKAGKLAVPLFVLASLAPLLCSSLFYGIYRKRLSAEKSENRTQKRQASGFRIQFRMLDACILDSFEAITKIGGYIILFSILIALMREIPFPNERLRLLLLSSLEITNGIPMLGTYVRPFHERLVSAVALNAFGGFCAAAQTKCMVQDAGLSMLPYLLQKLVTALAAGLLTCGYLYLCVP